MTIFEFWYKEAIKTIFLFILVFACYPSVAKAQEPFDQLAVTLSSHFFLAMQSDDFDKASSLFKLPNYYTTDEIKSDREGISKALKIVKSELGLIVSKEINKKKVDIVSVTFQGGSIPYWEKYPQVHSIVYRVIFQNEGEGYVTISFCNIDTGWKIRSVKYGLSEKSAGSVDKINRILKKLIKIVAPEPKTNTKI